jgi:succinoglycan biosynthesis transport protein ExoP
VEESTSSDFNVRAVLRLLLQQKWVIAGTFALTTAATVFVILGTQKVYEAQATLEYDPTPPRPLGSEVEDVAAPAGNFLAGKEWYQTQNTIIASRTIARKVVEKLGLHHDADFMNVPADRRARWSGADVESASDELMRVLSVRQERETRISRISVRSSNPKKAALLANSIADAYMNWVMEERLGSTVRAVEWLSKQLDDISGHLAQSELSLYNFRRKNNVLTVSLADQQNEIGQTIHSLSLALTEATGRRIQAEAKLQQLEAAVREDPMKARSTLISSNHAISELRSAYQAALLEREGLSTKYGPNHPMMRRVLLRIDGLVDAARDEIMGLVEATRAELREAQEVERKLRGARQRVQNEGLDLNLHEIDYNRMERERANNEKLHTLLLQRTTETNLTRMLRVSPVRLVDRAPVPEVAVWPRPFLIMALGCAFGLVAGIGLAVLRVRMDRSVNTPDDVTTLGVTVLGLVPTIQMDKASGATGRGPKAKRRRRGPGPIVENATKDLIVHTNPRSAVAECCRTIRTNLSFMMTDKPLRSLVVTSPGPAEGKSTLTISLAITMANSGRRVLLVDTDLRRPRLHKAFGLNVRNGVTSMLAGETTLDECVQATVVENLHVLPCGALPPNPSELLHTTRFAQLLEQLKQKFDLVVLDSPPVGVVIDAAIIGPQLDGVVLVAQSGSTSREALAIALRQMKDVGSRVLGCVLNDVDLAKHGAYGGYYYYSGGYYYASPDDPTNPGNSSSGKGGGTPAVASS